MIRTWVTAFQGGERADYQNLLILLFTWISGLVVWFSPSVGVWFVLLALLVWLFRGYKNKLLIQRNPLNLPIAVFLLTALVGVWAAYDPQTALHKFLILLAGVLIFYVVSGLEAQRIYWFYGLVSLTALVFAAYFLLSNDWVTQPADFGLINRIGESWMAIRVSLPLTFDNANIPAGILAMMLPWVAAYVWYAQVNLPHLSRWLGWTSLTVVLVAIFMSSSRAVWGALAAGLAAWAWWEICNRGAPRFKRNPHKLFFASTAIISIAWLFYITYVLSQFHTITTIVPGGPSGVIRAKLYHQTTDLIPDFWLTGGGLQSFAGLYSQYILDIPYLYFKYAHNLWLDIALEQGTFGILSFLIIYGWTAIKLYQMLILSKTQSLTDRLILYSLLVAIFVFVGHGFVDDAIYGISGTPFLFIIPGLLASLEQKYAKVPASGGQALSISKRLGVKPAVAVFIILALVGISFSTIPVLKGAVQANLGAVKMAKLELAGFPLGSWEDGLSGSDFDVEKDIFHLALESDPSQRTANHGLGRIAMQDGEFQDAVKYLSRAHMKDPNHTGIRKSLGFAYVWTGDFDKAFSLIHFYPEAAGELESYCTWWQLNGNAKLSLNANKMLEYLNAKK